MKKQLPHLVFSHANGFPAPCYAKFLGALQNDFSIRYLPRIGHHPDYPVTDGWSDLTRELIDFVAGGPHPVIAVGHSLGGFISFMAAAQRPDLFSALILLDAPIFSAVKASGLQLSKRLGFVDWVTPARATRNRRRHWANEAEALAHFRSRPLFRHFDPECLADYVRYGMIEEGQPGGGRVLWFDPEIEYRIYGTISHKLHKELAQLKVPAGFIGGRKSRESRVFGISAMRGRFRFKRIEGGHLFPFEHPLETAQAVREMAAALLAGSGSAAKAP